MLSVAGKQISGSRESQQDSLRIITNVPFLNDPHSLLLVMCDGMGGHVGGSVASKLICDKVVDSFKKLGDVAPQRLKISLGKANDALAARCSAEPELRGMGTTVIAAVIADEKMFWLSVGDSPLWLLREGDLTRLNEDHSMAPLLAEMVERGEITKDAAARDPLRNRLRAVVNGDELTMIDLSSEPLKLKEGDQILLASDGVETLGLSEIAKNLKNTVSSPCERSVDNLLNAVVSANNPQQDNASAILVKYGSVSQENQDQGDETDSASQNSSGVSGKKRNWFRNLFPFASALVMATAVFGVLTMCAR